MCNLNFVKCGEQAGIIRTYLMTIVPFRLNFALGIAEEILETPQEDSQEQTRGLSKAPRGRILSDQDVDQGHGVLRPENIQFSTLYPNIEITALLTPLRLRRLAFHRKLVSGTVG
ncbi:hypothetical protein N7478_012027 [Penicillium angulare]|uniref:uncharacterized protein n=1 Tax=Penicillium angulare TaxID=116970 RepID=UPI002540CFD5|nr:uncharacterized protein N7478_012027 [Penicillium angulare]KAJ5261432.1 hypothetical protein N7478_012027 [Penicillium angulare]